jgi:uncharacterized protein (TIGR03435 family)
MMRAILLGIGTLACSLATATLFGQQPPPALVGAQFEVVSIKPHKYDPSTGGGMRTLPDGAFMMTSQPIRSILTAASPEPVREVTGYPDWVKNEQYDIVAKPAPGSNPTPEQRAEMMRNMLIDRLKVAGHVEEVERNAFALVVARRDGRLGPQLTPSTLDCTRQASAAAPPSTPPPDAQRRCGMRMGPGLIESGGIRLDMLVNSLTGLAGGFVTNRTGLDGYYSVTLRFTPLRLSATGAPSDDDAPQFVTALQEQLGLKLVPEKMMVKIFVIDHIERPTPD